MDSIVTSTLKTAGLDKKEAFVYEEILRHGPINTALLLKKLPIKRGDLYNVLSHLERGKFIESLPEFKKLTYKVTDPEIIDHAVKTQERHVHEAKENLDLIYSLYNLNMGKPGVRFAQGLEGIKEIFNETLKSKTEIVGYGDVDGWLTHLGKYTKWYGKERLRKNIKERIILPDTATAKKYFEEYDKRATEIKFVPHEKYVFSLEMNVFDDKVIYVTLREPFIALLISDKSIADTQRAIFELTWSNINT